ncbi:MAG: DUF1559 domain-containing protein [Fimbriimonadia bacterium]|jgi:prepilin-type N-terminal cleavage/methylation domain-containing protein/prepilin-type processing-associated H-X9-DG protein
MRRPGFTLIELLVVIAIIAILAAILFPVFARARESAKQTECMSNQKQLGLGVTMYLEDFRAFPPLLGYITYDAARFPNQPGWFCSYWRYAKSKEIARCHKSKPLSSVRAGQFTIDYIHNSWLLGYGTRRVTMATVRSPAKLIVLYCFGYKIDDMDPSEEWGDNSMPDGGKGSMWWPGPSYAQPNGIHSGGYNAVFTDGHAKFIGSWNPSSMTRGYWVE